jgi:hypothetical protein
VRGVSPAAEQQTGQQHSERYKSLHNYPSSEIEFLFWTDRNLAM